MIWMSFRTEIKDLSSKGYAVVGGISRTCVAFLDEIKSKVTVLGGRLSKNVEDLP